MNRQIHVFTNLAILAGAVALLLVPLEAPGQEVVTAEEPVFSNPTEISNFWCPVSPGAVKVFIGRDDGARVTVVESHLDETRDFDWNGQMVTCRIVQELKFESGRLLETERLFFAQSDSGDVWMFGETEEDEDDEEDDEDGDDPNGWVVGQLLPTDPEGVIEGASPSLYMPANPQVGDLWTPEDVPPQILQLFEAKRLGGSVRVPAGRFPGVMRIRESNPIDGDGENHWFAPGVGRVKSQGAGERQKLQASTIR